MSHALAAEAVAKLLAVTSRRPRDDQSTRMARTRGVVYTPEPLVELVVEHVLAPWKTRKPPSLRVLDPACGDGRFLAAAARWMQRHRREVRVTLVGIERDAASAACARAALSAIDAEVQIVEAEALLGATIDGPFDAVVGNPPYIRSIRLREHDPALWRALRGRFVATSHGEWDIYAAFLERSLAWVRPRGRVGLVVPSRWLTAAWATRLRAEVASAVEEIIDFGAAQVFPDATTYASIVVLEPGRPAGPALFVRNSDKGWSAQRRDVCRAPAAPWIGESSASATQTLGDVAQISKGTGTNADKIFVVRGRLHRSRFRGTNGYGHPVDLEAAAVRPCLRGRDVRAAVGDEPERTYCVMPYRSSAHGRVTLIPWDELEQKLPRTAAYLIGHRQELERRERGRFAGEAFYRFGRPQNLAWLLEPSAKAVFPDVTARGRALVDVGSLVLDSAYAARPLPGAPPPWNDVRLLAALLGSAWVRRWLDDVGVRLRGGYVRMKTAFLVPMPLPPQGDALARAAAAAAAEELAAAAEVLDELARDESAAKSPRRAASARRRR